MSPGGSPTFRRSAKRPRRCSPRRGPQAARDLEGRALVLLAELALHADGDVAAAHDLADDALAILACDELAGLYDAHAADHDDLLVARRRRRGHAPRRGDGRARAQSRTARAREPRALVSCPPSRACAAMLPRRRPLEEAEALAAESGSREAIGYALAVRGRRFDEPNELRRSATYGRRWRSSTRSAPPAVTAGRCPPRLRLPAARRPPAPRRPSAKPYAGSGERTSRASSSRPSAGSPRCSSSSASSTRPTDWSPKPSAGSGARTSGRARRCCTRVGSSCGAGHADEAEASFAAALEIIEPTMYGILTREIRRSLDSLDANTGTGDMDQDGLTPD